MYAVRNWLIGGIAVLICAAPSNSRGAVSIPDTVTLNSLAQYYAGVKFDHAKHVSVTKDCADCHHHTTGTLFEDRNCVRCHRNSSETKNVACKSCHASEPFSAAALKERDPQTYHLDKPGLKGAYHITCLGCHERKKGPTGCEQCHVRTPKGNALYRAAEYAPKHSSRKDSHH